MVFLGMIIRFFKKLFGLDKDNEVTEPTVVPTYKIGARVLFTDVDGGVTLGTVTSIDPDVDPSAPYSVTFDGDEEETGTFAESELTLVVQA